MPQPEKRVEPDSRYATFFRTVAIWLGLITVWVGGVTFVLIHQSSEIQSQRRTGYRTTCTDQNVRHDKAVKKLDDLIAGTPIAKRDRARAGRDATVALIDALVPLQNCERLVKERVK